MEKRFCSEKWMKQKTKTAIAEDSAETAWRQNGWGKGAKMSVICGNEWMQMCICMGVQARVRDLENNRWGNDCIAHIFPKVKKIPPLLQLKTVDIPSSQKLAFYQKILIWLNWYILVEKWDCQWNFILKKCKWSVGSGRYNFIFHLKWLFWLWRLFYNSKLHLKYISKSNSAVKFGTMVLAGQIHRTWFIGFFEAWFFIVVGIFWKYWNSSCTRKSVYIYFICIPDIILLLQ